MNIYVQIILGFILADLVAGLFHWFEDTYLDYCINIPFIGKIAKDNEMHHYFPRSMLEKSSFENILTTLIIVIIFLILVYLYYIYYNKTTIKKYFYLLVSFIFFITISNLIHKYSHMRDCERNGFITFLQKTGILCSSEHHKLHHKLISEKYCVITEYNNYILDNIYFWRILENIIYYITSIKPNRKPSYDDYNEIHNYMHNNAKLECPQKPTKEDINILHQNLKRYKNCINLK